MHNATVKQREQLDAADVNIDIPASFVFGKILDSKYDIKKLASTLIDAKSMDSIPKPLFAEFSHAIQKGYLDTRHFQFNSFAVFSDNQEALAFAEEGGCEEYNKPIRDLMPSVLAGDSNAIDKLSDIVVERAKNFAHIARKTIRPGDYSVFISDKAPWKDYADNMELQSQYPSFGFVGWNDEVYMRFLEALKDELGHKGYVYYKPASEHLAPYFTNVAMTMIWDQFAVLDGKVSSEEVAYKDKPSVRAFYSDLALKLA